MEDGRKTEPVKLRPWQVQALRTILSVQGPYILYLKPGSGKTPGRSQRPKPKA